MKNNPICSLAKRTACFIVMSFILLLTQTVFAQTISIVKDINPGGASNPNLLYNMDGTLFFVASSTGLNSQLWKSDGTESGTMMVKDINPTGNDELMNFIGFNGKLFFEANDGTNGKEIWVSDGTNSGTLMIKNIHPSGNGGFSQGIVFNGLLYFSASNGVNGSEWWVTDGTESGTNMLVDSSTTSGSPEHPCVFDNNLFFNYNDGIRGKELWKSDGTAAATTLVKDINTVTPAGSIPQFFTEMNGQLFFGADNGSHGRELWVTDGTEQGTVMLKDIRQGAIGSDPKGFVVHNGSLFFPAHDGVNGTELWISDGTEAGTQLFKDINPGAAGGDIINLISIGNHLFFTATDGNNGRELWISDGTPTGTHMLKNIHPSGNAFNGYFYFTPYPVEYAGKIYFAADDGNGFELWFTDGTESGTLKLEYTGAIHASPLDMIPAIVKCNNVLIFSANYDGDGNELYKVTDGGSEVPETEFFNNALKIFPNPANNVIFFNNPFENSEAMNIQIRSIQGEIVYQCMTNQGSTKVSISIDHLTPALYTIRISSDHQILETKFLVIK